MVDGRQLLDEVEHTFRNAPRLEPDVRSDARREARLLVSALLDCSMGELARRLAMPGDAIESAVALRIREGARRRARGEPLAYVVGSAPFRNLMLQVDSRVLIPRPETEIVVERALQLTNSRGGGIAVDIGTGSGAIALALATEGMFDRVIATDISRDALAVARGNAARCVGPGAAPVEFRAGPDLVPLKGVLARVIVSNPPYIAYEEARALPSGVRDWEPVVALFASDTGMTRYDALLAGSAACLEPHGLLVLEVDARRGRETADRALQCGWVDVQLWRDLSGRDRVLTARRNPTADSIVPPRTTTF